MGLTITAYFLIDFLGAVQGVIFGVILISQHKSRGKETTLLGVFIISYSMNLFGDALMGTNLAEKYPGLQFLPLDFGLLHFPLFFVYVQYISILATTKNVIAYLYPGLMHLTIQMIAFTLPNELREEVLGSLWYNAFSVLGYGYSVLVGFIAIKWVNRHIKEVENQYSSVERKKLVWAKWFILLGIMFVAFTTAVYFLFDFGDIYYVFASLVNVGLLYWISMRGIMQLNIKSVTEDPVSLIEKESGGKEKAISATRLSEVFARVQIYLMENNKYLNSELTIADVALAVREHPRLVSQSINKLSGSNFNSYINSLRIHHAKLLLSDPLYDNLSVEGIGVEVGFSSKSSFYEAFKRVTSTTPSSFKLSKQ